MKKLAYLAPVFCLAALAGYAKADTLKFNGSSSEIGPYQLTLDGSTSVNLFCLDDFRTIHVGETWNVNINNGSDYLSSNKHSDDFLYEEEAYIYSELGASNGHGHTYTDTDVQEALWNIFDDHANTNQYADALESAAYNFSYTSSFLSGFDFYIPTQGGHEGDDWNDNLPQEMIGSADPTPAPEPSSLLLMGSGLAGLAGLVRRKFANV